MALSFRPVAVVGSLALVGLFANAMLEVVFPLSFICVLDLFATFGDVGVLSVSVSEPVVEVSIERVLIWIRRDSLSGVVARRFEGFALGVDQLVLNKFLLFCHLTIYLFD